MFVNVNLAFTYKANEALHINFLTILFKVLFTLRVDSSLML